MKDSRFMTVATRSVHKVIEGAPPRGFISFGEASPLIAIAAAHLPMLGVQYQEMWSSPDYNFFPLVWLAAGALAWRDTRELGDLRPGRRVLVMWLLVAVGVLLLASGLIISTWMGCVVSQGTLLVAAYAWGGGKLVRALLPAWLLLLALLPRYGLDELVRIDLQRIASEWSGAVLDQLGLLHLPLGNVIGLAGRRLLVEEACSGVHSMFVVLAGVLAYALWVRTSIARALVLLAAAVFWVLVANTARIVLVAYATARWDVDFLTGWRHAALGLVLLALPLGLLASTDRLYRVIADAANLAWRGLADALSRRRELREAERSYWQAPVANLDPRAANTPSAGASAVRPTPLRVAPGVTRWPRLRETALAGRGLTIAFASLAVALTALFFPLIRVALGAAIARPELARRLDGLKQETMPDRFGPFQLLDGSTEKREMGSEFGEDSRTWRYRFGPHQAIVSVDSLFGGWHELSMCYANGGWDLRSRVGSLDGTVHAEFSQLSDERGMLLFSVIDARGKVLATSRRERWMDRIAVWREPSLGAFLERVRKRGKFFQVQLLVTSGRPLTAEERREARAFFVAARDKVIEGAGLTRPVGP